MKSGGDGHTKRFAGKPTSQIDIKGGLLSVKYPAKRAFIALWLFSALLVTLLRLSYVFPMSYDLALQIQAAQNFLDHKGISIYMYGGLDLSAPAEPVTLTHFPVGYSLYAAGIFALGGGVGAAVRLLAATATLAGWWGWSLLAFEFFKDGLKRGGVWKWVAFAIAVLTPLLFTIPWSGTDIFLWAALPWVLRWVTRASEKDVTGFSPSALDLAAGVLCGLAVLMRYASVFVAFYCAVLILWQSRLRFRVLVWRSGSFALGLLPILALQIFFTWGVPSAPAALSLDQSLGSAAQRIADGIPMLKSATYPWAFWFPGIAMKLLFPAETAALSWQLGIVLATFVFLALTVRAYGVEPGTASRDPRITAFGLFIVFPVLLLACMVFGSYDFLEDARHYWPLLPLSILVMYSVASLPRIPNRTVFTMALQIAGATYLAGYIALTTAYVALFFDSGPQGRMERGRVVASVPAPWPSLAIATSEFSGARQMAVALLKQQPNSVLLTSAKLNWFVWDSTLDRSRMFELSCGDSLRSEFLSGPAHVVILTFDEGQPHDLWADSLHLNTKLRFDSGSGRRLMHVECFERLPGLVLRGRFPEEGLKVLEAEVPANSRVDLRP